MHLTPRFLMFHGLTGALLALAALPASGQTPRGPRTVAGGGGDVVDLRLATGAGRILFRAEGAQAGTLDLYSVPTGGGSSAQLNPTLPQGGRVAADYRISPDGNTVYFRADADAQGQWNLYASPVDGSSAPVRLNNALGSDETIAYFDVTPDGSRVVYLGGLDLAFDYELRSAPADGSGAPVTIAGATVSGRVLAFEITPDSQTAVFQGWLPPQLLIAAVPLDGSSSSVNLTEYTNQGLNFELGVGLASVDIAPDSNTVAIVGGLVNEDVFEIFRVEITNHLVRTKITGPMIGGGDVYSLGIAPDGVRVVYTADQVRDGTIELFSVPLDGSMFPSRINGFGTPVGTIISDFIIRSDSQMILYRGSPTSTVTHFYSTPILGGVQPKQLHGVLEYVEESYDFTADGLGAIFLARTDITQNTQLYSVPIDLSTPALLLTPGMDVNANVEAYTLTTSEVVFRGDPTPGQSELLVVPQDGSMNPLVLNARLPIDADVLQFACDGIFAYFVADALLESHFELFRVPLDGSSAPVKLNGPLAPPGPVEILTRSVDSTTG